MARRRAPSADAPAGRRTESSETAPPLFVRTTVPHGISDALSPGTTGAGQGGAAAGGAGIGPPDRLEPLTLRIYLDVLWRRKWTIVALAIAAFFVSYLQPKQYEAAAELRKAGAPTGNYEVTAAPFAQDDSSSAPAYASVARVSATAGARSPPPRPPTRTH